MKLESSQNAFREIRKSMIKKGITIYSDIGKNEGKHRLFKTSEGLYWALFKKAYYCTFNREFRDYAEINTSGMGDSINMPELEEALRINAMLLYIYPDGKIYEIHPKVIKHIKLCREQECQRAEKMADYGNSIQIYHEQTYSFPLCLMQRFNP